MKKDLLNDSARSMSDDDQKIDLDLSYEIGKWGSEEAAPDVDKIRRCIVENNDLANTTDHKDRTALMMACAAGDADLVCILLECKADPNKADKKGYTPLMYAVGLGEERSIPSFRIIKELLKYEANILLKNEKGETALNMIEKKVPQLSSSRKIKGSTFVHQSAHKPLGEEIDDHQKRP